MLVVDSLLIIYSLLQLRESVVQRRAPPERGLPRRADDVVLEEVEDLLVVARGVGRPGRRRGAVEDVLQEAGEVARVLVPRAVLVVGGPDPLLTEELDAEGGDERDELLDESGVVELDDVDLEEPGEGARRLVGAVRQQREDEREAVDVPARGVQSEMRRVARLDTAADGAQNITLSISFLPKTTSTTSTAVTLGTSQLRLLFYEAVRRS